MSIADQKRRQVHQIHPLQTLAVDLSGPQNRGGKGLPDGRLFLRGPGIRPIPQVGLDKQESPPEHAGARSPCCRPTRPGRDLPGSSPSPPPDPPRRESSRGPLEPPTTPSPLANRDSGSKGLRRFSRSFLEAACSPLFADVDSVSCWTAFEPTDTQALLSSKMDTSPISRRMAIPLVEILVAAVSAIHAASTSEA